MASRKITRGTSYDLTVTYEENGSTVSIVGDTLYLTVKSAQYDNDATDTSAALQKTVTVPNDGNAVAGSYTFALDYPDTYIEPGKYFADVIIKRTSTGNRYPLALEKWVIVGTPTNRNS